MLTLYVCQFWRCDWVPSDVKLTVIECHTWDCKVVFSWWYKLYSCRIQLIVSAGNLLDGTSVVDFTTNTTVDILVEDVNNNDPIFLRNYTIQILENIRPGLSLNRCQMYNLHWWGFIYGMVFMKLRHPMLCPQEKRDWIW